MTILRLKVINDLIIRGDAYEINNNGSHILSSSPKAFAGMVHGIDGSSSVSGLSEMGKNLAIALQRLARSKK